MESQKTIEFFTITQFYEIASVRQLKHLITVILCRVCLSLNEWKKKKNRKEKKTPLSKGNNINAVSGAVKKRRNPDKG